MERLDGRAIINQIVADQFARGPDAQEIREYKFDDGRLLLGHNRLSIIDLSVDANQPMSDTTQKLHIVFNGEIYNYLELRSELEKLGAVFSTRSDTEVILEAYKAWGPNSFSRFIGMFAIALYDSRSEELVLARDRFGVKPLHYWTNGRSFLFASRPTVIASAMHLKANLEYVSRGIRYKYYEDDTDISPYEGLSALESSTFLTIKVVKGTIKVAKAKYYDFESQVKKTVDAVNGLDERAIEENLLALLRSACSIRLRADVPVGISVSGGVDSSAIAALMGESIRDIRGYSFASPDDPESEGPLVDELSRHLRLRTRYVCVSSDAEIVELFWKTLHAQDAPFPHASIMAQFAVFQAAHRDGMKVLLGGQGGDEALMGYRKYYLFVAQSIIRERRLGELPHFLASLLPFFLAVLRRAHIFISERRRYSDKQAGMGTRLLLPVGAKSEHMGLKDGTTVRERQILDVTRFSLPSLLRYEDRNSMGNSIESRLPFMDQRVMEFGVAISERAKLNHGFGKWILRKSFAGLIPDSIRLNRDKRGFDVNQRGWIERGLGHALRSALTERRSTISQLLPAKGRIEELFSDRELVEHPQAFKEAVSLVWIADRA